MGVAAAEERLKHGRLIVLGDPDTGVAQLESDALGIGPHGQRDGAAVGSELDRVGEQVEQDAFELHPVAGHVGNVGRHLHGRSEVTPEVDLETVPRLVGELLHIDLDAYHCNVVGLDLVQAQKIFDEVLQAATVADQTADQVALRGSEIAILAVGEQLGVAEDAGHRGAELVASGCDEGTALGFEGPEALDRLSLLTHSIAEQILGLAPSTDLVAHNDVAVDLPLGVVQGAHPHGVDPVLARRLREGPVLGVVETTFGTPGSPGPHEVGWSSSRRRRSLDRARPGQRGSRCE